MATPRLTIGPIIRLARVKANLTTEQAAKKLGISTHYVGHLERSDLVHLSDDLVDRLAKQLRAPRGILSELQEPHNRRVRLWKKKRNAA